jgi:hypothetical protein
MRRIRSALLPLNPNHHRLLDLVADGVRRGEVDLLNHRGVVARRDEQMIAKLAQCFAIGAGEADGDDAVFPRGAQRRQNVRRAAGGGERQQHIAARTKAGDLAGEHLFEAVIIGDRRQRRGVGGQRDRGVAGTILFVAADDLGGDVLGVGGAAAIADDQELVAGAKCGDDDGRDRARGGEQRRILRRAREAGERLLEMRGDRISGFFVQDAP